jgi:hypothetical protein
MKKAAGFLVIALIISGCAGTQAAVPDTGSIPDTNSITLINNLAKISQWQDNVAFINTKTDLAYRFSEAFPTDEVMQYSLDLLKASVILSMYSGTISHKIRGLVAQYPVTTDRDAVTRITQDVDRTDEIIAEIDEWYVQLYLVHERFDAIDDLMEKYGFQYP